MRTFTVQPPTDQAQQIVETYDDWAEAIFIKHSPGEISISVNQSVTPTNGQGTLLPMDVPVRIRIEPRSKIFAIADVGNQQLSVIVSQLCGV